jgi:FAD/FMN-containing dehydrogenase
MRQAPNGFLAAMVDALGPDGVVTDSDVMAPHLVDWMRRYHGDAIAVLRPADTEDVVRAMRVCHRFGVAVVAQGGNTGLVGGSVGTPGSVVLSTSRLNHLGPVDEEASQITVGAGATLDAVHVTAAHAGLRFPVDLAARGSATIGGMVATNAGGLSVLRFGPMRAQIGGIEAVLADGSVISHLQGLIKDNTGYDLVGLLCGSEGTLAVITAVRLRLVPLDGPHLTLAVGVERLSAALTLLRNVRAAGVVVDSAELIRRRGVELVAAHVGKTPPTALLAPFTLLLAVVAGETVHDRLATALETLKPGELIDSLVAETEASARELWAWRERHTESISAHGIPVKLDVSLPISRLAEFEAGIDALVDRAHPGCDVHVFGHLGDGNLHVNVLGVDGSGGADWTRVEDTILRRVVELGGSISAEHGIGRMKAPWLHLNRSPAELSAMRAIKRALDPTAILNPGVILGVEAVEP